MVNIKVAFIKIIIGPYFPKLINKNHVKKILKILNEVYFSIDLFFENIRSEIINIMKI